MYRSNAGGVTYDSQTDTSLYYAMHVYDCENTEPARIPSQFPIKTALLHSDRSDILQTDANGRLIITFDCASVQMSANVVSTFYNNDNTWASTIDNDAIGAATGIGLTKLTAYPGVAIRMVAAKIKLTYIGAELTRQGLFFGAHDFDATHFATTLVRPSLNQMQDMPVFEFHTTQEGIEIIYKPYDLSYLEFTKDNTGAGVTYPNPDDIFRPYCMHIGIVGAPASTNCIFVEQFATWEYIVAPAFQDSVMTDTAIGDPAIVAKISDVDVIRGTNPIYKHVEDMKSPFINAVAGQARSIGSDILSTVSGGVRTVLTAAISGLIGASGLGPMVGFAKGYLGKGGF